MNRIHCAIAFGTLLLAGCEASSISAPLGPSLGSVVPSQGSKTLDQRLYEAGAKYLGTYNSEENHKAMSCGEGNGRIGCNWAHTRDSPQQAMADAQANCEAVYGSCQPFAVNGQLHDWAADIADQYDPLGAPARNAAMDDDQRNASSFGNKIDGAIGVLGGVQGVVGAAQGTVGSPGGHSQRGAFADCRRLYGSAQCADRENRMGSIGPGAVTSTRGQGTGTYRPTSSSTITGISR